jgi:uncharacterized delta-60 repeat protein
MKTVSWRALAAFAAAALLFPAVGARAAGEIDLSFDASPISFSPFGSADVRAVLVLPDGRILIGGAFTEIQGVPRVGIARLHPNGALDTSFVSPFSVTAQIPYPRVLVRQPDGKILVGGAGMNVGALNYSIVRLLPDGAVDPSFNLLEMAVSSGIEAILLMPDGKIYIGGDFSNIGPLFTKMMARLFPDGSRDPSFDFEPTTDAYGGPVHAITLQPDGNLLIGGEFLIQTGGQTFDRLARVRPDATVDTTFNPAFNLFEGPDVHQIVLRPDGSIYVVGQFSSINGVARFGLARLTAAGVVDPAFDVGMHFGAYYAAVRQADGKLVVTGDFFIPPDGRGIARLLETGAIDAFGPPLGLGPGIGHALTRQPDGKYLVGGPFFNPGGVVRERLVRLLGDAPVNAPPNAVDDAAATPEDVPVTIDVTANDTDLDGDPLTVTAVTAPAHGTAVIASASSVTYTPHPNWHGPDAFTYTVGDGHGGTDTATVAAGTTPVNDPPVAADDAYLTTGGTPLTVPAPGVLGNDTDAEGTALSAVLVAPPASGTLALGASGGFTFTPAPGFAGSVTFTYRASDGAATSNVATVLVGVAVPIAKVVATGDPVPGGGVFATFPEAASIRGSLVAFRGLGGAGVQGIYGCMPADPCVPLASVGTSIPGGTGTFSGFGGPSTAGRFTSFLGTGAGQAGVYSCDRAIPTDPCVPIADLGSLIPGGSGAFTGFADVGAAGGLTGFVGTGASQQGVYACDRAIPTDPCTPVADLTTSIPGGTGAFVGFGALSLTADVTQQAPAAIVAFVGNGSGQQGVYACDRTIPTDPCTRVADRTTAIPGGTGTFTAFSRVAVALDFGQADPPPIALFVGNGPGQQGVYSCDLSIPTDPCTPVATLATAIPGGAGTFTGFGAVATSRTHAAFLGRGVSGQEGIYVASTLQKVVATGDPLAGRTVAALRFGRDGLDANRLAFNASFTDGTEGVFVATLGLVGNLAPSALDDAASTSEGIGVLVPVVLNDFDPDGDALAVTAVGAPAHGTAVLEGDVVLYTPAAGYQGPDAFTYAIADGHGGADTATVDVTVADVNHPPAAQGDVYTTAQGATLAVPTPGVLANDHDLDGDPLSASLLAGPAHGTLTLQASGAFTYAPAAGYAGADAFTYVASDGALTSNTATVFITVTATAGVWRPAGTLTTGRAGHTATRLPDGRVLVAGGLGAAASRSAELYDPATGTFTTTGGLERARVDHTATLLADGRVLVAGSSAPAPGHANAMSAEIYDPATGLWTPTGGLAHPHGRHTATLLASGRVLVVGGGPLLQSSPPEIYDPATGTWSAAGTLSVGRVGHQATRLANGRVLVSGGATLSPLPAVLRRTDVYDPATGTWTQGADLSVPRLGHTATLLADGRVLAAGGTGAPSSAGSAERYDPATGAWTPTAGMGARALHGEARLATGRVLLAAGVNFVGLPSRSATLFDPTAGTWSTTGSLATPRILHTTTLLANGRVLVVGGTYGKGPLRGAELYEP